MIGTVAVTGYNGNDSVGKLQSRIGKRPADAPERFIKKMLEIHRVTFGTTGGCGIIESTKGRPGLSPGTPYTGLTTPA